MQPKASVNDFVIKFANVNGTGSASANGMFAKAIFRMGIPVSPRNIFPSNIQGMPTWYEVRVSEYGYLGRRGGTDIMVCVNPQSMQRDVAEVDAGGYFIYDSTKPLDLRLVRKDIHYIGIPFTEICLREYTDARQRLLFKNVIYVGALAALLNIDFGILKDLVSEQFKGKEKLITPNVYALELGYQYASSNFDCPVPMHLEPGHSVGKHIGDFENILMDGNTAIALGAVYAGATVAAWYPITPSTSVIDAFDKYCRRLRIDPGTGKKNYAIVQAEDELSAMGMVIGACWNGARAFTATSGPGVSLMSEFLGLAYFAEVPAVLVDVQRAGPSTGMPTRTQQSDVLMAAYASHGDTKHVMLFPGTPAECFSMTLDAFDLAERLQTPVIIMSDLELGMNECMSPPLEFDDERRYDRGKVLDADALDDMTERWGRYLDVDGDGIPYRTYPGAHPSKGSYFTRGSSKDEYAAYTEDGAAYVRNMDRLLKKFETAKSLVPPPKIKQADAETTMGAVFFGTTASPAYEATEILAKEGIHLDTMRIRSFPFNEDVEEFIETHDRVFIIEQNRDGQMRRLMLNETKVHMKDKLVAILEYDGLPITALKIASMIRNYVLGGNITPIHGLETTEDVAS
ncbi:2-ketoglutarate: nadp oxidoreductase,alpha subunit [Luminiphilus syltensis NOR5-1B]|uniref:2-ketoglutarate: nadp oxidoreductase,alpha subunit n=1 Tax=Luminiphilus syltensis NOR5-1B TaxID=565045 RepID=B8KVJ9_9GAMM|nr:2-oxoacid:acceptor oxidoreductase subunit alpha [Luminiphilus syltensis]EED35698.1 2-ketoglutarate: nadp oxidoreductase,alpha subunit [Luminiphilus syltensis NOR5-1B]